MSVRLGVGIEGVGGVRQRKVAYFIDTTCEVLRRGTTSWSSARIMVWRIQILEEFAERATFLHLAVQLLQRNL